MANRWLVQKLIANAKRRGFIVQSDDAQDGFAAADFLEVIDDVIRSKMVPLLKRTRESYLVKVVELELASGTARYPIPGRAAAEALHSILYEASDDVWVPLQRTEVDKAYAFASAGSTQPFGYYLEDDSVVFVPTPSTQTVRFLIFNRPNLVVEASAVGYVSAINTSTKAVTVLTWDEDNEDFTASAAPSAFSSSVLYDLVKGAPGFRNHGTDLAATVASNVLTFAETLPTDLAVGDFVCLAGETPIAQIPAELHPLLAQEVTRSLLEAKGDAKAERAQTTVDRMTSEAMEMLTPRVTAAPRYIHNFNAPGWKRGLFRWRGWR